MRAINHALTGAIIGVVSATPVVAVPAAFASHFVLDAIPHHNSKNGDMTSSRFTQAIVIDGLLCAVLVQILVLWQPAHWLMAVFGAFLAVSPDFMWIPKYMRARRNQEEKPPTGIVKFHSVIQWFQRPIGGSVELAWFLTAAWTLYVVGTYIRP